MGLSIENYVPNSSRAPLKNAVRCAIDGEEVNIFLPANIFASKYFCQQIFLPLKNAVRCAIDGEEVGV